MGRLRLLFSPRRWLFVLLLTPGCAEDQELAKDSPPLPRDLPNAGIYEYEDGVRAFLTARQQPNCPFDNILSLSKGAHGVWVAVKGSSIIELWDEEQLKNDLRDVFDAFFGSLNGGLLLTSCDENAFCVYLSP